MISFLEVSHSYDGGATSAVRDITLDIEDGETLVILGSSGSGKTTILKLLNRLQT
ncbi:MAG: ATP-binding cassette domain-containing protein, partial [Planctomycetes bacterium]|nr:ATP-binding cassette domain-containing protein [Planctomycetota bacterium]